MLDIKSPYLNSVVEPARLVTLKVIVSRLPEGRKKPMIGSIMSFTNAVTNLDAACPNTKAITRPIIPKVFRKSKKLGLMFSLLQLAIPLSCSMRLARISYAA